MAQYTVDAYQWTGTGYNATYNTSHTAVLDDDDAAYQGAGDAGETVSIDGGAFVATGGTPYVITVNFTDTNGDPQEEEFYFFYAGASGGWYFIPAPDSDFTVGATLGNYQSHYNGWNYSTVTCFVAGTRIATPSGARLVEELCAGDKVLSADGQTLVLRQALTRHLSAVELARHEKLRPVCISAGALGPGLPTRDLWVSRQHRVLVRSVVAERMFGARDVLVAAIRLTDLPGIFVEQAPRPVCYVHLVFDAHEIVLAEGAPSESFYPGPAVIDTVPDEARAELARIFPQLTSGQAPQPARLIPDGGRQKKLIARLARNGHCALSLG